MIISKLKILQGVPFNADDNKVITFDNLQEQYNFFSSRSVKDFENLMFVKGFLYKKIKLEVPYETIKFCNYIMFINQQNPNSKWNYAYIKNFEYESDACTYIEIEIDYFQTYMGEIEFKSSYIERGMVGNDTFGVEAHFTPENGIDVESYYIANKDSFVFNDLQVCVCYKPNLIIESSTDTADILSQAITGNTQFTYRNYMNGAYKQYFLKGGFYANRYLTGCAYKIYNLRNQADNDTIVGDLWLLEIMGYSIVSIYMIPREFNTPNKISLSFSLNNTKNPYYDLRYIPTGLPYPYDAYEPKNNKCYATPYIYLEMSNFQGQFKKYSYQYFFEPNGEIEPNYTFYIFATFMTKFNAICFPVSYKIINDVGVGDSMAGYEYGLAMADTPECDWNSSMANAVRGIAKTAFNVIADTAMISAGMPPTNTVKGLQAQETQQQQHEKQITSRNIGGASGVAGAIFNNTDNSTKGVPAMPILQAIHGCLGWLFLQYIAKNIIEIDTYFSIYGYTLNRYGKQNILCRQRWNYIKVINANIQGNIPIIARNYIINKLAEGITFWHDKNNFDYGDLTNNIINKDLVNDKIFQS